jgi:oxygen-independent coproporphyrinogen III oxidase
MEDLFAKYDQALPRYTSYPTVPYWDKAAPAATDWRKAVSDAWLNGGKDLSLYIHLLYCESLCTYCACNTRITKNHAVEEPYISRLLKEWEMYREVIGEKPRISELHLGGGTPTFFSPENLSRLIDTIRDTAEISEDAAFSFEAHPANTTSDHLRVLYDRGFRRISIGVQDFNPEVQRLINRRQSEDQVAALTTLARITGFTSINFDLVYGLPKQTVASILETVQ